MGEKPELVGICAKCGRGFFTLPKDMTDQFYPAGSKPDADGNWEICGGAIEPIPPSLSPSMGERTNPRGESQ